MFGNFLLLFCVLYSTAALILPVNAVPGRYDRACNNLTDLSPSHVFDVEKIQGLWYFNGIYVNNNPTNLRNKFRVSFEPNECWTFNMTKIPSPQGPMVSTEFCKAKPETGELNCDMKYAKIDESILPLESVWYGLKNEDYSPISPYAPFIWLQTDNENYALAYQCSFIELAGYQVKLEMMLVYTRQPRFDNEEVLNVLHAVIKNQGFTMDSVIPVDNTVC